MVDGGDGGDGGETAETAEETAETAAAADEGRSLHSQFHTRIDQIRAGPPSSQ